MRKKILSLILILMLISAMFVLTGCGESSNEEETAQAKKRWYWSEDEDGEEVITDGEVELHIGDTVNYDEQTQIGSDAISSYTSKKEDTGLDEFEYTYITKDDQEVTLENNDVDWVVLGLDEKTGEILITSDELVYTDENLTSYYDENYYILYGEAGYENGVDELNNICEMFGYGEGATGARSITQDDVDTVLGYDFEEDENVRHEGDTYTFYWDGDSHPYYETSTGSSHEFGTGDTTHRSGFRYYDNGWFISEFSETATEDNLEYIAEITLEYSYEYDETDIDSSKVNEKKIIFLSDSYWIATQCTSIIESAEVDWGLRYYSYYNSKKDLYCASLVPSLVNDVHSTMGMLGLGIRPVVSLSSDIELSGNSSKGWKIE